MRSSQSGRSGSRACGASPPALRRPYWRLGIAGGWEEISLLRRGELAALFGEPVIAERLGPLAKSWIAVRA